MSRTLSWNSWLPLVPTRKIPVVTTSPPTKMR
jgi:hypothetical protein